MKKTSIITTILCGIFLTSCQFEIKHHIHTPAPVPIKRIGICDITYHYQHNVAIGAIQPVVTCTVYNAEPNAQTECYMEFRAFNRYQALPVVKDHWFSLTDVFGEARISVTNGNCIPAARESVTLYATCKVDGQILNTLEHPPSLCGS